MWAIEYYEQHDGVQPAEVFEDALDRSQLKLAGKLARAVVSLQTYGNQLVGGLIEPCRGYAGLWEIRVIFNQSLARELFGFDASRVVLLHGYVKRAGQPASQPDLKAAAKYWADYLRTHRISPEVASKKEGSNGHEPL